MHCLWGVQKSCPQQLTGGQLQHRGHSEDRCVPLPFPDVPVHDPDQVAKFLHTLVFLSGCHKAIMRSWAGMWGKLHMTQGGVKVTLRTLSGPPHYSEPGQGGFWKLDGKREHGSISMCRELLHMLPELIL